MGDKGPLNCKKLQVEPNFRNNAGAKINNRNYLEFIFNIEEVQ